MSRGTFAAARGGAGFKRARRTALLTTVLAVVLIAPSSAGAAEIASTATQGINRITVSPTLQCQVTYFGDTSPEFYGGIPGSCITILRVDGQSYSAFGGNMAAVSQSEVGGAGTAADPFELVTIVDAGTTGMRIRATTTFVSGDDFFRTDYQVTNLGAAEQTVDLTQWADCYLQNSDLGFGFVDQTTGGVYCSANAHNSPPGRIEGFVPLHGGSSYLQGHYSSVLSVVQSTTGPLPNTCGCTTHQDNGMALRYHALSIPAGGSATRGMATAFSPVGAIPDTTAPTVTISSPADGARLGESPAVFSGTSGQEEDDGPVHYAVFSGSQATGSAVQTGTATRSAGTWQATPSAALAPGTYTLRASQSDQGGNVGTATSTFTIDATQPDVTISSPADGSSLPSSPSSFAGGAGTEAGDFQEVHVTLFEGSSTEGSPVQTRVAPADEGSWSAEPSGPLAPGTYTLRVTQTDSAGNVGTDTSTFTVDTTPPEVTITSPADGSSLPSSPSSFAGGAGSDEGDVQEVQIALFEGSGTHAAPIQSQAAPADEGSWSAEPSAKLAPGTYTLRVTQTDAAGNVGTATSTFSVASPPPVAGPARQTTTEEPPPPPPDDDVSGSQATDGEDGEPAPPPPDDPEPQSSGTIKPVKGDVCVTLPDSNNCVSLEQATAVPVGSVIDTRQGEVELRVADNRGVVHIGNFEGGRFRFGQAYERFVSTVGGGRRVRGPAAPGRGPNGTAAARKKVSYLIVTQLKLVGGDLSACGAGATDRRRRATGRSARKRFSRFVRARSHGRFRVIGRHSSGIERGTDWTTTDNCQGTRTTVHDGEVLIKDYALKKQVLVSAGESYLARRPAARRRR